MSGFQTPITIKQAIDRISSNAYLLPAFQREYVWSSTQVENLFDSIMKGYPISSMLFWKVSGEAKRAYKFYKVLDHYVQEHHIHNDAFDTNQINDFHAVLDGQQRLTSLYLGLCGSYAYHRYRARYDNIEANFPTRHLYLNITHTLQEEDSDKTYDFSFKEQSITKQQNLYTDKNGDHWFRVGYILTIGSGDADYDLDDFAEDHELSKPEKKLLNKLKAKIFEKADINYYEIEDSNPDVAVNIFVRINSGGSQLSFSDIMMSMAIAGWRKKDARTEINRLVEVVNNKGFNISHDYILKSFLYLYHKDVRFRIKSFNNEFISKAEDNWEDIRDSIDELFVLLRNFGLDRSSLISNNATLPILYYIYHRHIYKGFATSVTYVKEREAMRIWLMKTLLFRTFGKSSDAQLQASRKAFTDNVTSTFFSKEPTSFPADELARAIQQQQDLTDEYIDTNLLSIHKDNGYAFAILSLLYSNLDYRNVFHKDHLHPYVLCSEAELDWNVYDSILNLQMLDANENMSKNAKPLKQWVDEATADCDRTAFLKAHLIPDIDLELTNFDDFIEQRRLILRDRVRQIFSTNK